MSGVRAQVPAAGEVWASRFLRLYGRGYSRGLVVIDSVAGDRPDDEVVITYRNTGTTQATTVKAIQATYEFEADRVEDLGQVAS